MSDVVSVRVMSPGDVAAAMALKHLAGWNQLRLDWERFLEFEPRGCFVAELEGALVGTATTISYQDLFGWIGMVLVHPEIRRRGIGRALMSACVEYLEGMGVQAVKLDATPMGKQLYDTMGFVDEYSLQRWMGVAAPQGELDSTRLRALEPADLDELVAFDTPLFGANRDRVLRRLLTEATVRVVGRTDPAGKLLGYAAVRPGQNALYLGPWIAPDPEVGAQLWQWGLGQAKGLPMYVDVIEANHAAVALVTASGLAPQREFIRQYRGQNVAPGQPEWQYGICGPEIG